MRCPPGAGGCLPVSLVGRGDPCDWPRSSDCRCGGAHRRGLPTHAASFAQWRWRLDHEAPTGGGTVRGRRLRVATVAGAARRAAWRGQRRLVATVGGSDSPGRVAHAAGVGGTQLLRGAVAVAVCGHADRKRQGRHRGRTVLERMAGAASLVGGRRLTIPERSRCWQGVGGGGPLLALAASTYRLVGGPHPPPALVAGRPCLTRRWRLPRAVAAGGCRR